MEYNAETTRDWLDIGLLLQQLNKHERAIQAFDKALNLSSDDQELYLYKGKSLQELDKHIDAIHVFDEGLKAESLDATLLGCSILRENLPARKPQYIINGTADAHLCFFKGLSLQELDMHDDAIKSFNLAIKQGFGDLPLLHYFRRLSLQKLNRQEEKTPEEKMPLIIDGSEWEDSEVEEAYDTYTLGGYYDPYDPIDRKQYFEEYRDYVIGGYLRKHSKNILDL